MREIKFRAWDLEYGADDGMHYDIFLMGRIIYLPTDDLTPDEEKDARDGKSPRYRVMDGIIYYITQKKDYIIEQFTGLKDKNDKEIWEGDIVRCSGGIMKVEWSEDIACFECIGPLGARSLFGYVKESEGVKVLGNIHENPEILLKDG